MSNAQNWILFPILLTMLVAWVLVQTTKAKHKTLQPSSQAPLFSLAKRADTQKFHQQRIIFTKGVGIIIMILIGNMFDNLLLALYALSGVMAAVSIIWLVCQTNLSSAQLQRFRYANYYATFFLITLLLRHFYIYA